jgi:hypothetical protein
LLSVRHHLSKHQRFQVDTSSQQPTRLECSVELLPLTAICGNAVPLCRCRRHVAVAQAAGRRQLAAGGTHVAIALRVIGATCLAEVTVSYFLSGLLGECHSEGSQRLSRAENGEGASVKPPPTQRVSCCRSAMRFRAALARFRTSVPASLFNRCSVFRLISSSELGRILTALESSDAACDRSLCGSASERTPHGARRVVPDNPA